MFSTEQSMLTKKYYNCLPFDNNFFNLFKQDLALAHVPSITITVNVESNADTIGSFGLVENPISCTYSCVVLAVEVGYKITQYLPRFLIKSSSVRSCDSMPDSKIETLSPPVLHSTTAVLEERKISFTLIKKTISILEERGKANLWGKPFF